MAEYLPAQKKNRSKINSYSAQRGFSLIELTLVLFIMALIGTFSVSRYAYHIQRTTLIANTHQIVQFLKYSHSSAQSLKTPLKVSISYNNENKKTQLRLEDLNGINSMRNTLELEGIVVTTNINADEIIFSPTAPIKVVQDDIEIPNTQNITMRLFNTKNLDSNLVIFYNSGAVQLLDNVEGP